MKWALAATALLLTACGTAGPQPAPSSTYPGPQPDDDSIRIAAILPDDGVAPVTDLIDSARRTVDVAMYEVDTTYEPIMAAFRRAVDRGVEVRVLMSRQLYPPTSAENHNFTDRDNLRAIGVRAELSSPKFSYFHEKAVMTDSGTPEARAIVGDFNLGQGYFDPIPGREPGQRGARGMGVWVTDPADLAEMASYFEADWPPYQDWPASTRPNLVWSPAAPQYRAPGNSDAAIEWLMASAEDTLDLYVQQFPVPSQMLDDLVAAAGRGVQVRIIGNDSTLSEAVPQLQSAGIAVRFNPATPQEPNHFMYVHTKTIIRDGADPDGVAFVGSVNAFLDVSIETERELGAMVTEESQVKRVQKVFDVDFESAKRHDPTTRSPSARP